MTAKVEKMNEPLNDLGYFTEWGGRTWNRLTQLAVNELQKNHGSDGADLLDIGTRYGKMAVLFSLVGARVTGIDLHEQFLDVAREEARKRNATKIDFMTYSGDLDVFPDESFDVIFTKSVLVVAPNLEVFLIKISKKLMKPNGKVVFLEISCIAGNTTPKVGLSSCKLFHGQRSRTGAVHISYGQNRENALSSRIFVSRPKTPPILTVSVAHGTSMHAPSRNTYRSPVWGQTASALPRRGSCRRSP